MTRPLFTSSMFLLSAGMAVALRLFHLGTQSLWLDELFSVFVARRAAPQVIQGTMVGDTNPPLFAMLLHITLQFGSDETAARIVSLLFSLASLPLLLMLARALFDMRVAQLATLALALNPLHIFYAQEARMYALLAFCQVGAMYFFVRAWRNGLPRDWMMFALMSALAFYTHNLAFLNLLALDVFALIQRDRLRTRWRALALSHVAIALLFAPWLAVLVQQVLRVQAGFWNSTPSLLVLLTTPYLFLFGHAVPFVLVPFSLFAVLALIAFASLAAARVIRARTPERDSLLFVVLTFAVPLITLYVLSLIRPIFVERTLLPASFGLYLLLAWAVAHGTAQRLMQTFALLMLLLTCSTLLAYYFDPSTQKPAMREAASALLEEFQLGDAVIHTSDSSALAFMYYAPQLPNEFLSGDPDYLTETTRGHTGLIAGLIPLDEEKISAGHARVWLVLALDHNEDYQRARVADFDRRWKRQQVIVVHAIALILY